MTSQLLNCHDQKQRNFVNSVDNVGPNENLQIIECVTAV